MLVAPPALADRLVVESDLMAVAYGGPHGLALQLRLHLKAAEAKCPSCGHPADRVHSTYWRTIADLALQGVPVLLRVRVRRFRCDQPACTRATFAELLADLAAPRARRTLRLIDTQVHVGMAVGATAGARLLPALGTPSSPSTLLRSVHRAALGTAPTPKVLGVDDWAIRRGHRYGTVLVDLERRRPVDLLPDREAATLARWLREHPGVEVISRDRAEAYAEGARQGAPAALQVADRWHLLKNTGDVLERVLHRHRAALAEAAVAAHAVAPTDAPAAAPASTTPPTAAALRTDARRARREAQYAQLQALRAEGLSIHAISQRTGLSRVTVRKYLRAPTCPTRAPRRTQIGVLSAFDTHLRSRWGQGCHDAKALWAELRALGFRGSYRTVQRHVQAWPLPHDSPRPRGRPRMARPAEGPAPTPPPKPPSPRVALWWLLLPPAQLTPEQGAFVAHLTKHCAAVRAAQELAVDFGRIVSTREVDALQPWLARAAASEHGEFRDFVVGLRRDQAAVEAAVREPWSNGQTEGQVNKIKMLKRQMYGRASVGLLRQRLLFAA